VAENSAVIRLFGNKLAMGENRYARIR